MSQRLSRKEIKRDEFMESMGEAIEYVRGHSRTLIGLGLAVLAVLIVVALYMSFADRRSAKADEALAVALKVQTAAIDPVAADPEDPKAPTFASEEARTARAKELFEEVVGSFGRSDAGGIARVYLGQIAADAGDLEGARDHWQQFLDRGSEDALAVEVQVNLMALDRAAGRGDELVTELRARLSGADSGLPADLLLYQLALTLDELDRGGEAVEAYQRIVDEYPQSAYAAAARARTGGGQAPLFGS